LKDILSRFSLFHSDSTNFTNTLCDFSRDTSSVELATDEYLYIGFDSRFYSFFLYGTTYNTNSSVISLEYFDGSSWQTINAKDLADDTQGFSRVGFVSWKFDDSTEWEKTTHESIEQYWVRVSVDTATTSMELNAINCLFADDNDIIRMYPPLSRSDFKLGETDYINIHVVVRDEIVQEFRNKGLLKRGSESSYKYLRVVAQDLLDFQEVRMAARHLAIAKIFWGVSDNPEDSWAEKAKKHES